ncbi:CheR family methyltransferase [Massilia sp. IC2-476]|uniref:CheR family methyltransferase n=1 Tax=Massilia sp. IC2-476 TaxID=2887199 RepID=UPI001D11FB8E|nr:CheR family methyltransferase [Massilia sp. IC2-476]MCC2970416.1 PAS domain S-box protein [Massilia sp. IC2-476]
MDIEQLDSRPGGKAASASGPPGFPIVGIGASAGGFPALITLLEHMPPDPGMALVIILHLGSGPSAADKVLQRATDMPVVQVTHTVPILPDKVYVIPPDRSLKMSDGHLVLDELERRSARPVAIDVFLRTLAETHGEHAIGVVLSGMGSDGTAGLACIKEMGGVTIAQLPAEAGEDAMPRSAIESGMADFVLAAAEIPRKLVELRDGARRIRQRALEGNPPEDGPLFDLGTHPQAALREVLSVLRARTGHDFSHYRRQTLQRRLERRLQVRSVPDMLAYCRLLHNDPNEAQALLKDLLIGVTSFFRDREAFDALDRNVLPDLFATLAPGQALRAWVAACSTGEEAYTLAMLLATRASGNRKLQVFATDIDEHAIEVGRAGLYPAAIADHVPPQLLQRYFTHEGGQYKVRRVLRDMVLFTNHNLLHDPAFSRVDLITCRNFLIYLNPDMHQHVLQQFHFALNPGGILMLGSAETAEAAGQMFEPLDPAQRIYRARPVARRPPAGPPAPLRRAAAAPAPPAVAPAMRRGRLYSFAEIHLHKSAELAPPSILLDARGDIVHVSERAARFLRPGSGEPTRELAALLLPELQLPLRAALFQARKGGREVRTGTVRYGRDGATHAVDMLAVPFHDQHAEDQLVLIRFDDAEPAPAPAAPAPAGDDTLARQLEEELSQTRRQLHDTVEQAESAARDMHIYGEEMQTTVEELRAAAEEAARGREMLASRNQELEADNHALQKRAEEAAKAHDDLANLIASSGVATIFLDRAMRIVRFTPRIADFFNVIPADIGRPLAHITNNFDDPQLAGDAAQVFDTLQAMEREVRGRDGRYYIVRVHPYRTTTDRIAGAVMSFFDVTERKRGEQAQRVNDARLAALFESMPVGVGVFNREGDITMFNQALHRYLPTSRMPSRDPARLARWRAWDADGRPLGPEDFPGARALRGERVVPGVEMLYTDDDGREIWTQVSSLPVIAERGEVIGQCVVITDIDALKRSEAALRENEGRLRELAGEFAQMVWETDASGMVVTDSPSWRAYTGQTLEAWLGMGWLDAVHPEDRAYAARRWSEAVAARGVVHARFRVRRADGQWQPMKARAVPLVGADGRIRKWVGLNVELNADGDEDPPRA